MKTIQKATIHILCLLLTLVNTACDNRAEIDKHKQELQQKASAINHDFYKIRVEVQNLADTISTLYLKQHKILPTINKQKYKMAENGVFYKPNDDGGAAVFVSGYYPVTEQLKNIVYFTEPVDKTLKRCVNKYPEIVQAYFNDSHSYNRIYPFFDVLSQYEAKMDIPSYNFYYLADKKHNSEQKSLWVDEPYVDPAGRGWMVSAIAPVYYHNELVGVPGIDVTINTITQRYISDDSSCLNVLIDNTGTIVAAEEVSVTLLSFPPLLDHRYIETIKQDTYRKEQYNLMLSKDITVRKLAEDILKNKKDEVELKINGEKLTVLSAYIPELKWYLLEIIK